LGGDNSNVKLAVHKVTKERVAVKTLKKALMNSQELERARREVDIMRKLTEVGNPYIIKLLDAKETSDEFHIFLEYVSGGELVALILKNKGLSEWHTHKLFLQILSAIQCCHSHNIIHRDIKLQNILLDHNKNIKLIDFGLSNFMEEGVFRNTFCGTPAYASPEILLGTKYTGPEVDLWSLGVVLYSMLTSEFPFTTIGDILKGKFKEPENVTSQCVDLLKRVLRVEKETRETLQGVLDHPWVTMTSEEVEAECKELFHIEIGGKIENGVEAEEPSVKRRKTTSSELVKGKMG
jgi:serine/threonine protein kinase